MPNVGNHTNIINLLELIILRLVTYHFYLVTWHPITQRLKPYNSNNNTICISWSTQTQMQFLWYTDLTVPGTITTYLERLQRHRWWPSPLERSVTPFLLWKWHILAILSGRRVPCSIASPIFWKVILVTTQLLILSQKWLVKSRARLLQHMSIQGKLQGNWKLPLLTSTTSKDWYY